jgi:prepilin-type N-terminal cleavage/methylation domain-containing protein
MNGKKYKKGMTIIEMLVAIGIFSIGMAGFTLLFMKTWQTNSFVIETGEIALQASRALTGTIKELRKVRQADNGDFAIKTADNFDLTVYLDDDNDDVTERVHYFLDLDADELKKGVSKPNSSLVYPSNDQTTETLAQYVVNTEEQPLFSYFGQIYPGNPLELPIIFPDVRLVKIHLWVNIKPLSAPDNINLESFVEMRNLNEN